jgi:adenosine deaminase
MNTAVAVGALPKVLLHEHLDGGLRLETLFELLRAQALPCPAPDPQALGRWFDARAHAGSLEQFLRGFALTVAAMATPAAMERVAFEAAEDARADGCVLAEFRIAPLLFEQHGVSGEAAVEALLAGLRRSALPSGLIVCAMRHLPPQETLRAARLALAFREQGVVAFDLAGAELGHPPGEHASALQAARDGGLALSLHAGEADGAERVVEALRLGAARVGHGIRLADVLRDPQRRPLVDEVVASGIHLEVCPTSNVHTGAAVSIAAHPITALWRAGVSVGVNTDNRLMSGITLGRECAALLEQTTLTVADLALMQLEAARHSFLAPAVRADAIAAITTFTDAQPDPDRRRRRPLDGALDLKGPVE